MALVPVAQDSFVAARWNFVARSAHRGFLCFGIFLPFFRYAIQRSLSAHGVCLHGAIMGCSDIKSERLSAVQWLGLVFAFGAVAFTLREGFLQELTPLQHWGDLLGVGGGICWAITTIVIRTTAMAKASAEKMLFYQVGVSAIALLLLSYFSNEVWQGSWSSFALTSLLIQSTAGAFASYLAWMWLLGRYPATKIGTFAFLTPVFALIFGALWLGEAVTLSLLGALAMVGVGIALVRRPPGFE